MDEDSFFSGLIIGSSAFLILCFVVSAPFVFWYNTSSPPEQVSYTTGTYLLAGILLIVYVIVASVTWLVRRLP